MNNKSEAIAYFTDYDNPYAPYEGRALRVSLSADVLFLAFGEFKEERGKDSFVYDEDTQSIGVDAEEFLQFLIEIIDRSDREAYARANEGTLPANHPSRIGDKIRFRVRRP